MWVFGYGSLVWRPAFPHIRSAPAWIQGWTRRFWQGSPDHRGTPQALGRVVTLLKEADAICWGRAYEIADEDFETVLTQLDHREQGGYLRFSVTANLRGLEMPTVDALVYVATEENPCYLGPASIEAIAAEVLVRVGPSGPNTEYVLRLDEALIAIGADDPHVRALADEVRRQMQAS